MKRSRGEKKNFVDVNHARYDDQKAVLEKINRDGLCPFCTENLFRYHHEEILKEGKFWILTYNQWPRENTKVHLLAIYKSHVEALSQMDPESGHELLEYLSWAEKKFNVLGGAFAIRFGETTYSGATVKHIHAQFMVPDKDKPNNEPVRFKIG